MRFALYLLAAMGLTVFLSTCTGSDSDADGEPGKHNGSDTTVMSAEESSVLQANDHQSENLFKGQGNEPFWTLMIDGEKMMLKTLNEGDLITTPIPTPKETKGMGSAHAIVYVAKTEKGELHVRIQDQACADNMSGEEFSHTVQVKAKVGDKDYDFNGCGRYLVKREIDGKWSLEQVNDSLVKERLAEGIPAPYIEFLTTQAKIAGNGGCNNFGGDLVATRHGIKLGPFVTTLKACENSQVEGEFLKQMDGREFRYLVEGDSLKVTTEGTKLIFSKSP